jgi:hypothetical protein
MLVSDCGPVRMRSLSELMSVLVRNLQRAVTVDIPALRTQVRFEASCAAKFFIASIKDILF